MDIRLELFVGAETRGRADQYVSIRPLNGRGQLVILTPDVETPPLCILNSHTAKSMPVKKVEPNVGSMHQALASLAMGMLGVEGDIFH